MVGMAKQYLTFLFLFLLPLIGSSQVDTMEQAFDLENANGVHFLFVHDYTDIELEAFADTNALHFKSGLAYLGFDYILQNKHNGGFFSGWNFKWLIGSQDKMDGSKYKLRGFRFMQPFGYSWRIADNLMLEPAAFYEVGKLKIKERFTPSKLHNYAFFLGGSTDLKLGVGNIFIFSISVSRKWDMTKPAWKTSKKFDGNFSANPITLDGWYYALKVGIQGVN